MKRWLLGREEVCVEDFLLKHLADDRMSLGAGVHTVDAEERAHFALEDRSKVQQAAVCELCNLFGEAAVMLLPARYSSDVAEPLEHVFIAYSAGDPIHKAL